MATLEGPWYKQFWLWFILTPLFIVMGAGFFMLYLAIVTSDGVIIDNPYKDGKGYVERTAEDDFARSHQLTASLFWQQNELKVQLAGKLAPMPESLELLIAFPTSEAFDVTVTLAHQGLGTYFGTLPESVNGNRQLLLQPIDTEQGWRLHYDGMVPPLNSQIELHPKQE
ncbi:MAG: FixH family protein [Reinekea sp.]|nr:FixH family protein [Reinekea sp.]